MRSRSLDLLKGDVRNDPSSPADRAAYRDAEAFSGAEFLHGPVALVSPSYPLLVFMPTDAACDGLQVLVQRLRKNGTRPWVTEPGPAATGRLPSLVADQPEADDSDAGKRGLRYLAHPRRATASRQMLRPIAGAMIRNSAMSRSNCAGNRDCAPSLRA